MTVFLELAFSARRDAHAWRKVTGTALIDNPSWRERCEREARRRFADAREYLAVERKLREKTQ